MPFGVTGGHFQPFGQIQLLSNIVDYRMNVQHAPRMFATDAEIQLENTIPDPIVSGLARLGHRVVRASNPLGTAQAIWIDWDSGLLRGGADARRDGLALGW